MDPYPGRYAEQLLETHHPSAWQIIKSYWQSEHRFPAYLFCTIVMATTTSLVGLHLVFTYWYYHFYEVLQTYDKHGAIRFLAVIVLLVMIYAIWAFYRFYVSRVVRSHGRKMAEQFIKKWLKQHGHRNAHPQLQNDADVITNFSIDLSMGLIGMITTFFGIAYVLGQLSDEVVLSLGRWGSLHMPGYLVWIGLVYALIGAFFTFKLGRPLLGKGEQSQGFWGKIKQKLTWVRIGSYQLTLIVPILVALPTFLDKVILITWLIQSLQAFNRVQGSLSSMVKSHPIAAGGNAAQT